MCLQLKVEVASVDDEKEDSSAMREFGDWNVSCVGKLIEG
jgi:hypothetical protein